MPKILFVGGLSPATQTRDLNKAFARLYGTIDQCDIKPPHNNDKNPFVPFESFASVTVARDTLSSNFEKERMLAKLFTTFVYAQTPYPSRRTSTESLLGYQPPIIPFKSIPNRSLPSRQRRAVAKPQTTARRKKPLQPEPTFIPEEGTGIDHTTKRQSDCYRPDYSQDRRDLIPFQRRTEWGRGSSELRGWDGYYRPRTTSYSSGDTEPSDTWETRRRERFDKMEPPYTHSHRQESGHGRGSRADSRCNNGREHVYQTDERPKKRARGADTYYPSLPNRRAARFMNSANGRRLDTSGQRQSARDHPSQSQPSQKSHYPLPEHRGRTRTRASANTPPSLFPRRSHSRSPSRSRNSRSHSRSHSRRPSRPRSRSFSSCSRSRSRSITGPDHMSTSKSSQSPRADYARTPPGPPPPLEGDYGDDHEYVPGSQNVEEPFNDQQNSDSYHSAADEEEANVDEGQEEVVPDGGGGVNTTEVGPGVEVEKTKATSRQLVREAANPDDMGSASKDETGGRIDDEVAVEAEVEEYAEVGIKPERSQLNKAEFGAEVASGSAGFSADRKNSDVAVVAVRREI
ncbi:hypothetical protein D9757_007373 [Collybiopsis confluens]|uniref:RRM domain-containing protein n=1 Tax=Collybiopsis confluens TaxID=2823264 RepID=A0A8H5HIK3_9AGAR|nr:hypothetical protein D9757_007373 [Collybiopsis confluens]